MIVCRSCITKEIESRSKKECPSCQFSLGLDPFEVIKPDVLLQKVVSKISEGLKPQKTSSSLKNEQRKSKRLKTELKSEELLTPSLPPSNQRKSKNQPRPKCDADTKKGDKPDGAIGELIVPFLVDLDSKYVEQGNERSYAFKAKGSNSVKSLKVFVMNNFNITKG